MPTFIRLTTAIRSTTVGLALVLAAAWMPCQTVSAGNQDDAKALAEGVRLFEEGQYQAAQEVLLGIDRSKLNAEQQKTRDHYLNQVNVALTMSEKAHRDLEDAGIAVDEGDREEAKRLLARVLDNQYAPQEVRNSAEAMLKELGAVEPGQAAPGRAPGDEPAAAPVEPAAGGQARADEPPPAPVGQAPAGQAPAGQAVDIERARTLTGEADDMLAAGRLDEAERLYQQALEFAPGYPEAVSGLARIEEHRRNVSGSRGITLSDRIRQQDAINWQRTETEYRETERRVLQLVSEDRYDEAEQLLVRARQIVESGRQFADPASLHEAVKADLEALEEQVRLAKRDYHEREVERIRRDINEERRQRREEVETNRRNQVEALMSQARQHRKDGDLAAAIGVLEQVLVIDPRNDPARWLLEDWSDQLSYQTQAGWRKELYRQQQGTLMDIEESKIPWVEELQYPKNWLEIIAREERQKGGQGPLDSLLFGKLDTLIPVDFDAIPFREVMERFAGGYGVNVHVNWTDLVASGVDPNMTIKLTMPEEVTLKKALTMALEQAGGPTVDLGYAVSDGVLTVATREWLNSNINDVHTRIYDITDLLQEVPDFDNAPTLDVVNGPAPSPYEREARPWEFSDDDDDDREPTSELRRSKVGEFIRLIQETVAPDTWRERGGSIGSIQELNNQLVVTQNTAAQEQVSNLLGQLREQRAVQIAVEARFITVQSNYLEELGIDLDIVLNNGNAGFDMVQNASGTVATDPVLGSRLLVPRQFSQIGVLPNPAGNVNAGNQFVESISGAPQQPYTAVGLVPENRGGFINSGSRMTPVPARSGVLNLTDPGTLASGVPGSFASRDTPALTLFGSFLDNIQVDFFIRATQADSRTTLLTAPKLVLSNGQRAWVAVVTSHAFVSTLQPVVGGGTAAQAPQTQAVNEGAVLDVQGTVSADRRYVTMTLRPGVGRLLALERFNFAGPNFFAGAGFIQLPQVARQVLNTTVNVPDGGTLLIGGQKLAAEIEVEAGVPVLSKIPVLKRLYSSRTMVKDEQVLLILVKPQILIQSEQEKLAFPTLSSRG